MLNFRTLLVSAGATLATVAGAYAADLPNYVPPPAAAYTPAPAYSWTGPYAGLVGGYSWGTATGWSMRVTSNSFSPSASVTQR